MTAGAAGARREAPAFRASVTGTMLADVHRCERRVHLDLHGDLEDRTAISGFVEMLWSAGSRHEEAILASLPGRVLDLSATPLSDRLGATVAALASDADWIRGARLTLGDLDGLPDLLHHDAGVWNAGDIKSGSPLAQNERDPRVEYALQTGFYAHLMAELGLGSGDRAFVIGSDGEIAWYDLHGALGRDERSLSMIVLGQIDRARAIRDGTCETRPALSSICGLCVWRAVCRDRLTTDDDVTLVAGLGRSVRPAIERVAPTVGDLALIDCEALAKPAGRTAVAGVGQARLETFRERARMLVSNAAPYSRVPLGLARRDVEHHVDLETDPTANDLVHLHGIWRRRRIEGRDIEDFVHFLAEKPSEERDAFAAAVAFLTADPEALMTTFSAFERSTYRRLAKRYPEVVSSDGIEAMFSRERCVDLYFDVVLPHTFWPLNSLGLKPIAKHLGFDWNDAEASGASSIAWFVEWAASKDPALLERILRYNCNDCIASRIVFDAAIALPVMPSLPWPPQGAAS